MARGKEHILIILSGLIVGAVAVMLVAFGNPANMGFCIACFLRDIAGGVGLHRAEVVQYIRPEIIGLVLGAMVMALAGKEFKVRGGSSPMIRFVLGFCVMVGADVPGLSAENGDSPGRRRRQCHYWSGRLYCRYFCRYALPEKRVYAEKVSAPGQD